MKQLVVAVLLVLAGWQGYREYKAHLPAKAETRGVVDIAPVTDLAPPPGDPAAPGQFRCDGRTRCSQMTSCAEATFFLKNCPGVEVYGNDGSTHCWLQWCKD